MMRTKLSLFLAFACAAPAWTQALDFAPVVAKPVSKTIDIPGELQPYLSVGVCAKVPGYVERVLVDRGSTVKEGQLLIELSAPELTARIAEAESRVQFARSEHAQATAQLGALEATLARLKQAAATPGAVSGNEVVQAEKQVEAAKALVLSRELSIRTAQAAVQSQQDLQAYLKITAPFAGVVTTRSTDIGALISATGGPTDPALFTVADQRKLRVYVRVPQNYSALVHTGMTADLMVPEYAGQTFKATVANNAQAVGAQSGTELIELALDNADGRIKSGDYATVSFKLTSPITTTRIPVTAIQYRHAGPVVAVVGPDNHVKIRPVVISRDLGSSVEIGSGLSAADKVVDNPPESLVDGDLVRVSGASAQGSNPKAGA